MRYNCLSKHISFFSSTNISYFLSSVCFSFPFPFRIPGIEAVVGLERGEEREAEVAVKINIDEEVGAEIEIDEDRVEAEVEAEIGSPAVEDVLARARIETITTITKMIVDLHPAKMKEKDANLDGMKKVRLDGWICI